MTNIIDEIEKSQMKENLERIDIGDTLALTSLILEGKKERKQKFQGVVIQKKGSFSRESVTIRKVTDGVGIEKTFLIHSPLVVEYQIIKRAKVRRAKLFFLRERLGVKTSRLKPR